VEISPGRGGTSLRDQSSHRRANSERLEDDGSSASPIRLLRDAPPPRLGQCSLQGCRRHSHNCWVQAAKTVADPSTDTSCAPQQENVG